VIQAMNNGMTKKEALKKVGVKLSTFYLWTQRYTLMERTRK